jgi:olfactory receptor
MLKYFVSTVFGLFPISQTLLSYCKIISTILRIPSSRGKDKVFLHVGLECEVSAYNLEQELECYMRSAITPSPRSSAETLVMYTVVTLLLNAFIYSLRSRDIENSS